MEKSVCLLADRGEGHFTNGKQIDRGLQRQPTLAIHMIIHSQSSRPAEITSAASQIAPRAIEVGALGSLAALALILFIFGGYHAVNLAGPLLLIIIMGAANWKLVRQDPACLWTPLFAFRVGVLVFFGVGGFLLNLFDEATRDYEMVHYYYSNEEAAKVNTIWIVATFLVIASAFVTSLVLSTKTGPSPYRRTDATLALGALFFGIGFGFFLLIELPLSLGHLDFIVPGSLLSLFQAMNAVGSFLIALWGFERGGRGYLIVGLLFAANVVAGIVGLNKSIILFPQLLISLAYLMKKVTVNRVLFVAAALTVSLGILQPLVSYGRAVHIGRYGDLQGGTVGERLGYAVGWFTSDEDIGGVPESEQINPFLRLSYHNVATYVVTKYDMNEPADTIRNSLVAMVPRVVWPEKPYTTGVSSELFFELSGQVGSSLTPTVPPDVYWNLGWTGIALIFPILGVALMVASRRCYVIVSNRDWIMMPFVLITFRVALSVDATFVAGILIPSVYAIIVYFLLKMAASVFLRPSTLTSPSVAVKAVPGQRPGSTQAIASPAMSGSRVGPAGSTGHKIV